MAALAVELGDVAAELRDYAEGIEADPGGLQAIEERLEAIDRLERKHGGSVESVLAHAERCRAEIARLEGAEERSAEAEAALAAAEARRAELGEKLSAGREAAAQPLEERVAAELEQLAMAGASLEVVLEPHPDGFGAIGPGDGRAAGRAQPGDRGGAAARRRLGRRALAGDAGAERPRPGGERRRRWSSTRSTPASAATPPASSASGCGRWAGERQVICITHLPQVASLADAHFRLEKDVGGERGRRPRSSGSTARASSPRSGACSAARAPTRPRRSTRASS